MIGAIRTEKDYYLISVNPMLRNVNPVVIHVMLTLQCGLCELPAIRDFVHFYYRYTMLSKEVVWTKSRYVNYIIILSVFMLIDVALLYAGCVPENPNSIADITSKLEDGFPMPRDIMTDVTNPVFAVAALLGQIINIFVYAGMFICGFKIKRQMNQNKSAFNSTQQAQTYLVALLAELWDDLLLGRRVPKLDVKSDRFAI
ncbi:unnamed protein product [Bursaphelenchus okinawaensis]|uniref:7TM_GPCR_Srx domain-containing protein n=1 Tax=Bursaphelenchus okinawaensis TaxID=465554 RepID=A0A811K1F3_9BILA|nr:unnamed protein product [Bursaphelenchus okinawaensis]CAG9089930.1 unnamed protein product [Bursaphelenchus okinawaensis]